MDNSGHSSRPNARVAAGGVFHLPKVTYSKETHDFLKCTSSLEPVIRAGSSHHTLSARIEEPKIYCSQKQFFAPNSARSHRPECILVRTIFFAFSADGRAKNDDFATESHQFILAVGRPIAAAKAKARNNDQLSAVYRFYARTGGQAALIAGHQSEWCTRPG